MLDYSSLFILGTKANLVKVEFKKRTLERYRATEVTDRAPKGALLRLFRLSLRSVLNLMIRYGGAFGLVWFNKRILFFTRRFRRAGCASG